MSNVAADVIMASIKPVISSAVSPFAVSAVRKLAMSTPSTWPSRICANASRASDLSRFVPRTSGLRTSLEKEAVMVILPLAT